MRYKSKEKKAIDVARGKKAEKNYAKLYTNVEWPTEMQDIKEHWDVKVEGYKIDVKAIKKDALLEHLSITREELAYKD